MLKFPIVLRITIVSNLKEANQYKFKFLGLEYNGDLLQPEFFVCVYVTFINMQALKINVSHKAMGTIWPSASIWLKRKLSFRERLGTWL